MTLNTTAAPATTALPTPADVPTPPPAQAARRSTRQDRLPTVQPVLEKLFELYPHLFGAQFLPLKLGIFQELLAAHPEHFTRETLKAALAAHTRSTRYLQCVADAKPRHDLQGAAVEPVAPEHVYLALVELFRRRQSRSQVDLRPKLRAQLVAAIEASGLGRQDYLARLSVQDAQALAVLDEAFAEHEEKLARREALRRAFQSSGKTPEEFAQMYGLDLRDVNRTLGLNRPLPVVAAPAA